MKEPQPIEMNIEHIALTIIKEQEIKDFYEDVLGMKPVKNFILEKELAHKIFGQEEAVKVIQLIKDQTFLEIFISSRKQSNQFAHLCFKVDDREALINKATSLNYECIKIERPASDLIFLKDKSGNLFEIKAG